MSHLVAGRSKGRRASPNVGTWPWTALAQAPGRGIPPLEATRFCLPEIDIP